MSSPIGWCDATWSPIRGCSPVGAGCDCCWAARIAARFDMRNAPWFAFFGDGKIHAKAAHWTGRVELIESALEIPLHWRKPCWVAVGLMGDWMHPNLPDAARDRIFAVMALCPQHTFICLTKRWEQQAQYFADPERVLLVHDATAPFVQIIEWLPEFTRRWPLPNVILGASAWDQASAEEACRWLMQTPAAKRLLCLEPLLVDVDLSGILAGRLVPRHDGSGLGTWSTPDWVIVGGETGPGARPMHPYSVRKIRDNCQAAGVSFWFKGWGEWLPWCQFIGDTRTCIALGRVGDARRHRWEDGSYSLRVGRRTAGRLLDGREWSERA